MSVNLRAIDALIAPKIVDVSLLKFNFDASLLFVGLSGLSLAKNMDALQITCDSVYQICKNNAMCTESLKPVIQYCDFHMCNQNACLDALQTFYRFSNEDYTLDVAFCVCK